MENLLKEIRQWREVPPISVSLGSLHTHAGLQPRNPKLTLARHAAREEAASHEQIERLRALLQSDPTFDLAPLLIAVSDGKRYVLDGHHRLTAYKRSRRLQVLVCIKETTLEHAALLSNLVNLDDIKPAMEAGQRMEAEWQFLAQLTDRGRFALGKLGLSTRDVAAKFGGLSPQTILNMMKRMEHATKALHADAFHAQWCNPITGWPRWKDARKNGGCEWTEVPLDVRERRQVEKCAAAIAKLQERFGSETYRHALTFLGQEAEE